MALPQVKAAYERNLAISRQDNFVEIMNYELFNERFFRIHAVGDFYDLEYFAKWVQIAKDNPEITFMSYTRNHEVFKVSRPDNLKLIYSMDGSTEISLVPIGERRAHVIDKRYKHSEHLTQIGDVKICTRSDCSDCLECWTGETSIGFPKK